MAQVIKGNKIIEDNALDNHIAQLEEILKLNKQINSQIVKTAKTSKKVSAQAGSGKEAKGIRDLTKALSESELAKRASIKIDKERQKLEIQLKALNSQKIQQNNELRRQTQDQTKTNKLAAELAGTQAGSLKRLRVENKLLAKEKDNVNRKTKDGAKRIKEINKQLDKNNKILEQNASKLGKQKIGIGRYGKAIQGLRGGLAQLGLAFGVFNLINDSFNVIKNFDQAQADLSSVLGVTRDQMGRLTEQAKELGATTKFTATQVSELQIAFAKLGFTQKEIENVTEATLQLAAAAGTDLDNAATIVGSTLRAFGLESSETQRVVDVMAKSFSSSSLDIEKFKSAMAAVAPVAAALGFSIEETTALIGTLTDAGVDASTAGTGLRNMFLDAKKNGIDFDEALRQIRESSDQVGKSFEIFGKRGSALGVILANNEETTASLTDSLNASGGAAKEMADKQLDTLGGAIDLLRSAWEGLILKFNDGTGITDILKDAIKFLAENLETIVSVVFSAIKAFVAFKVAVKAVTVASKLMGKSFNAVKLNVYAIALTAIVAIALALIDAFKETANASNLMARMQDEVTEKLDKEKLALEQVREQLKLTTAGSEERQKILDETNRKYGTTLENLQDEAAFVKQVAEAYDDLIAKLEQRLEAEVREAFLKDLIEQRFNLRKLIREIEAQGFDEGLEKAAVEDALTQIQGVNDQIALLRDEIKEGGELGVDEAQDNVIEEIKVIKKGSKKKVDLKKQELDALRKLQEFENLVLQNLLLERAANEEDTFLEIRDQRITFIKEELDLIKRLYGTATVEYQQLLLEFNKLMREEFGESTEQLKLDLEEVVEDIEGALGGLGEGVSKEAEDAEKKRLEGLEKFKDESLKIFKQITDGLAENIDKRIEEREREIEESKGEISRLKELAAKGSTDAAEAIKAEKIAIAQDKLEIEKLEKKKRNLLILVAGLELLSQKINSGDGNATSSAGSEMAGFIDTLGSLSEGTDYNIGQTLGAPQKGGTDGHLAWVDKEEKLLSVKNSRKLSGMHQDEVTRRALAYNNNLVSTKAIATKEVQSMSDQNIVKELQANTEAIKSMAFPTSTYDPDTGKEIVREGNKTTTYHHKPSTFRI